MLRGLICLYDGTFDKERVRKTKHNENKVAGFNLLGSIFPDCVKGSYKFQVRLFIKILDRDATPLLLCDLFHYYVQLILLKKYISNKEHSH